MALKKDKDLKIYSSIGEVAKMFGLNESTLRFWEKEFDFIHPKTNDRGIRFYKKEDIESVRLVHYLVKEKGMTLAGARQKLKENKANTIREEEIVHKLKKIKEELLSLKNAFDAIEPVE
ncbi:MAG: MerR family transcriptional regulator [Tannerellaceae bacterium]|jgi:DNA-binding transcriptional MerR regulator|nr:MerR family transcriptional regulator [Tannerellaceae bacterium]